MRYCSSQLCMSFDEIHRESGLRRPISDVGLCNNRVRWSLNRKRRNLLLGLGISVRSHGAQVRPRSVESLRSRTPAPSDRVSIASPSLPSSTTFTSDQPRAPLRRAEDCQSESADECWEMSTPFCGSDTAWPVSGLSVSVPSAEAG